jgi:2-dehydropantoate 2-reductase
MPFVMASVDSQGRVRSQINPAQKTLHSDPRWVDLFEAAGIPSSFEAHMLLWLRCHVPVCISFESISVAAQRRGNGASWAEAMTVARGMRGGFAIIERLGYRLYPSTKSLLGILPTFAVAALLWSVSRVRSFRELLATGANECRALIDVMVGSAAHADPALRWATAALLATKPREGASSVSVVISAAPP